MISGSMNLARIKHRWGSLTVAWFCCWMIWLIALTWLAFDGVIFLLIQAALAAWMSTLATTVSYWLGARARSLIAGKGIWIALNTGVLVGSVMMLAIGTNLGFSQTYIDPNSKIPFVGLSRIAFLASFFTLNFGLANITLSKPAPSPTYNVRAEL